MVEVGVTIKQEGNNPKPNVSGADTVGRKQELADRAAGKKTTRPKAPILVKPSGTGDERFQDVSTLSEQQRQAIREEGKMRTEAEFEQARRLAAANIQEEQKGEATKFLEERGLETELPVEQKDLVQGGLAEIEREVADTWDNSLLAKSINWLDKKSIDRVRALYESGDRGAATQLAIEQGKMKNRNRLLNTVASTSTVLRASNQVFPLPFGIGDTLDSLLGDSEEIVNNIQSSLQARKEMATAIARDVQTGSLTAEEGLNALELMEKELNEAEARIQQEAILSPAIRRSGQLVDIQVDMLEQRQAFFRARRAIASVAVGNPILANDEAELLRIEEAAKNANE